MLWVSSPFLRRCLVEPSRNLVGKFIVLVPIQGCMLHVQGRCYQSMHSTAIAKLNAGTKRREVYVHSTSRNGSTFTKTVDSTLGSRIDNVYVIPWYYTARTEIGYMHC